MASDNAASSARSTPAADTEGDSTPDSTVTEITLVVIAICAAIAIAKIAQPFLVPVVMGILMSYTLRPLVSVLERVRVPRFVAATLVIAAATLTVTWTAGGLSAGTFSAGQSARMAEPLLLAGQYVCRHVVEHHNFRPCFTLKKTFR